MIRINLHPSPPPPERPITKNFVLVMANVGVATVVALVMFVQFIRIASETADRNALKDQIKKLEPTVAKFKIENDKNFELRNKKNEISQIAVKPVEWWRIVDAVWDVIHENPRIWIDDVTFLDSAAAGGARSAYDPGRGTTPPWGLAMNCHSAGLDVTGMTKFRESLRLHPFLSQYFDEVNFNVDWQVNEEPEAVEKWSLAFRVQMIGKMPPQPTAGGAQ
jgi:hypothetical protein